MNAGHPAPQTVRPCAGQPKGASAGTAVPLEHAAYVADRRTVERIAPHGSCAVTFPS